MKKLLLLVSLCYFLTDGVAQTTYPEHIEAQIKQVENNFSGQAIPDGKTDNILDRMIYFSGVKYFFHDAGNEGFRGLFYGSVEDGNGIIAFVNSDNGDIIIELLNRVATVYQWKGF